MLKDDYVKKCVFLQVENNRLRSKLLRLKKLADSRIVRFIMKLGVV